MNNLSVAHSYVQNQQPSSWIDDPFQLGTYVVKGLAPMSHNKNLSNYAEELVGQYAKYCDEQYELSLDMLPDDDQSELVRLYLEATDRETSECVYGDDFTINSNFIFDIKEVFDGEGNACQRRQLLPLRFHRVDGVSLL